MSSWLSARSPIQRPPQRTGFYQALPEGIFGSEEGETATVVSAYYKMKSKHDPEKYRNWIRRFFRTLTGPIVFFTDADTLPFLEACEKASSSIHFVVFPRSEWKANDQTLFPEGTWEHQWEIDPEKNIHSVELYKVWFEKKEFVLRAIALNPFGSKKFVWTDAGILREAEMESILKGRYPVSSRIPNDRIMIMNIMPFTKNDEIEYKINGVTLKGGKDKRRIGGGVLAGTAAVWKRFSQLYDEALQRYLKAGLFIGKDQTLFATIILENKSLISLLDYRGIAPESWFYLLLYLGVTERVWKILRSSRAEKEKWDYQRFAKESLV